VTTNDCVQLTVAGTVQTVAHLHTLHFRLLDNTVDEQGLIDAWQANCRTAYRAAFYPVDNPCELYTARQICGSTPLRAPVEEPEAAGSKAGTNPGAGGTNAPGWLARVVSVRTAVGGRRARGRFYLGGLRQPDFDGPNLTSGQIALVQAYCDTLMSTFVTGSATSGYMLVVHSRKNLDAGLTCVQSSLGVVGFIVRSALGTQRSRRLGHGP
jgi:hypothetical protein